VTPRERKGLWSTGAVDLLVAVIAVLTLVSALWWGAVSWRDSESRQSASWVSGTETGGADDLVATTAGADTAVPSGGAF
jgi:hypothetical protein